jgi:hypothetical protein
MGMLVNPSRFAVAGGSPYATWDPAHKASDISLSGGNLIATGASLGVHIVLGTIAISGKRYFECSFVPNADSIGVGIAVASTTLTNYLGQGALSYGHYLSSNTIYTGASAVYDGTNIATTPVTVGFAVDGTSLWVRVSGESGWEGGGDPAAGTSPTLTLSSGTYYPACTPYTTGNGAVTLNAGQSAFSVWTPSGGFSGVS